MSNKEQLQQNNTRIQGFVTTIDNLPDPIPDELGNATADKVLKGFTFTSDNGVMLTGNMVLPIGLHISSPPSKTVYEYGETLDLTGFTVLLKVWDGEKNLETDVTEECTITPQEGTPMTTIGLNQVKATYTYNGLTYTVIQDLQVKNSLQSIAVTTMPNKTEYRYNEPLDITGLVVTATYANGATADVTQNCVYVPAVGEVFTEKGDQIVSVSYTEDGVTQLTQFTINVKGEATYHGEIETGVGGLSMQGVSVGDYGIFASGNTADAFSSQLVRTTLTSPSYNEKLSNHAAARAGSYALFTGSGSSPYTQTVAYSASLVKTSAPDYPLGSLYSTAGASAGTYAIFGGGNNGANSGNYENDACAYSSELVVQKNFSIHAGVANHAATSVGDYAIFAGGYGLNLRVYATACAFDSNLTRKGVSSLSASSYHLIGASTGDYAIFAGGYNSAYTNQVSAYNRQLVKVDAAKLSAARGGLCGASAGMNAVFAGGVIKDSPYLSDVVDSYDNNLVKTNPEGLPGYVSSQMLLRARTGASAGNFAIFRGATKAYVYEG